MTNIWSSLPQPFFCLAPMEGVTDTVFRRIVLSMGRPDVMFTEFISSDGLSSKGHAHVATRMHFTAQEKPLIAQIWGVKPDNFKRAANLMVELGFDGVDINFGCPVAAVVRKGACSAMIKTPKLAQEIIKATQEGTQGLIPVSVKTRIGFDQVVTENWAAFLLDTGIQALTIHGRTAQEMSSVPAQWNEIGKVVALRDSMGLTTKIIGNGDVLSRTQGMQLVQDFGVDGVMVGRGIFHDPWLFNPDETILNKSPFEKLQALSDHTHLFVSVWGRGSKGFDRMKRFVKVYLSGFDNAAELRDEFMHTKGYQEFVDLVDKQIQNFS